MTAPTRIGIIGSGPMGMYLLQHLTSQSKAQDITVFESDAVAGTGMPYRAGTNAPYMLCNAFSREIPCVGPTLADWLRDLSDERLAQWDLTPADISSRDFYPRVLLGQYLRAGFQSVCAAARAMGHRVRVHLETRVIDISPQEQGAVLLAETPQGPVRVAFDRVVIATGHAWPETPRIDKATLVSPWPYANVTALPVGAIGILGSALSAVDVAVALGHAHGTFEEGGASVVWHPRAGSDALRVTMVSKTGILPEADFYYPHPYEPLHHVHDTAMAAEIAQGPDRLLDRAFGLLWRELSAADPAYVDDIGLDPATPEGFGEAYFAQRRRLGAFRALSRGLRQARDTMRRQVTIPWRYALLRGHASFDPLLAHLSDDDRARFRRHLLPVFADCYAAVPHLSLERIAALHEAGALDIMATGEAAAFENRPDGGVRVTVDGRATDFDAMVDARGQAAGKVGDLPFPSLVEALVDPEAAIDAPYALAIKGRGASDIHCLAMPQLMERHPFAQGLAECEELAAGVADAVLADLTAMPVRQRGAAAR